MPTDNEDDYAPFASCVDCGGDIADEDNTWYDDDDTLCRDCHDDRAANREYDEQRGPIEGHDYKPRPRFYGPTGVPTSYYLSENDRPMLYFGIELEVECEDGNLSDIAEKTHARLDPLCYLKADGSLSYGFEIVSHPMSLGFVQSVHANPLYDTMRQLIKWGVRSWKTSTCGLHIHMSRRAFANDAHRQKFLYFVYENKDELVKFAGRDSHWAKFRKDLFLGYNAEWSEDPIETRAKTYLEAVKGINKDGSPNRQYERYLAVNRQNRETYELRFFRPSLQPAALRACIEFCAAAFAYTEAMTSYEWRNEGALRFDHFANWSRDHRSDYPDFVPRMDKRVYGIEHPDEDDGIASDINYN